MALHLLPADGAGHELIPDCRCHPEVVRVDPGDGPREAIAHRDGDTLAGVDT